MIQNCGSQRKAIGNVKGRWASSSGKAPGWLAAEGHVGRVKNLKCIVKLRRTFKTGEGKAIHNCHNWQVIWLWRVHFLSNAVHEPLVRQHHPTTQSFQKAWNEKNVREVQEQSLALAQVRWLAVSQFPQSHRVAVRSKMAFTERWVSLTREAKSTTILCCQLDAKTIKWMVGLIERQIGG